MHAQNPLTISAKNIHAQTSLYYSQQDQDHIFRSKQWHQTTFRVHLPNKIWALNLNDKENGKVECCVNKTIWLRAFINVSQTTSLVPWLLRKKRGSQIWEINIFLLLFPYSFAPMFYTISSPVNFFYCWNRPLCLLCNVCIWYENYQDFYGHQK